MACRYYQNEVEVVWIGLCCGKAPVQQYGFYPLARGRFTHELGEPRPQFRAPVAGLKRAEPLSCLL